MKGASHSVSTYVRLQGVPAYGIIDTAADITIVGGRLFKKIATIARLKKKNLKPPEKKPCDTHALSIDTKHLRLDGWICRLFPALSNHGGTFNGLCGP